MMKIEITRNDFQKIYEYALSELPDEACGLIAGIDRPDGIREIRKVYLLTNVDHTSEHFSIDPKEHLASIKDMRANGLIPLGNWLARKACAPLLEVVWVMVQMCPLGLARPV